MNTKSMIRTFAFAGVAVLSTLLAIAANHFSKPTRTDGDGDYDLIVSCADKPSNGVYFFENATGALPFLLNFSLKHYVM